MNFTCHDGNTSKDKKINSLQAHKENSDVNKQRATGFLWHQ